ncbi:MAG: PAS domain S-box protein [Balneolaceae bacterium]
MREEDPKGSTGGGNDRDKHLKQEASRYRALVEHGRDVIMILSPDGNPFYASPSLKTVLGYDPGEVASITVEDGVHPDDRENVVQDVKRAMAHPGVAIDVTPARMRHKNGSWRWMAGTITNMLDDPQIHGIVDVFRDVTDQKRAQEKMQEANQRLRLATEITRLGYWEQDLETDELYWSDEVYRIFGKEKESFIPSSSTYKAYIHPDDLASFEAQLQRALSGGTGHDVEYRILLSDGSVRWVREMGAHKRESGKPLRFGGTVQDVTEKKELELQLKERIRERECLYRISLLNEQEQSVEELLRKAVEIIPTGFQHPHITCVEITWQGESYRFGEGVPESELLIAKTRPSGVRGEVLLVEAFYKESRRQMDEGPFMKEERQMLETIAGLLLTKIEKIDQNESLRESLKEKETLLSEIHHRVKNNLAVVAGLLQIQLFQQDDPNLSTQLSKAMSRIQSIAVIHEQLYRTQSFSKLDFAENIRTLSTRIVETFQGDRTIETEIECDPVGLNINQAIPCTLIVNEVLTNALKHAFEGRSRGKIRILMTQNEDQVHLQIEDDGVGLPEDFETARKKSLGLQLVDLLASQLEAKHTFDSTGQGSRFELHFVITEIKGSGSHLDV